MKKTKGFKKIIIKKLRELNANQAATIDELEEKCEAEYARGCRDGMKAWNTQVARTKKPFIVIEGARNGNVYEFPFHPDFVDVKVSGWKIYWRYRERPERKIDVSAADFDREASARSGKGKGG